MPLCGLDEYLGHAWFTCPGRLLIREGAGRGGRCSLPEREQDGGLVVYLPLSRHPCTVLAVWGLSRAGPWVRGSEKEKPDPWMARACMVSQTVRTELGMSYLGQALCQSLAHGVKGAWPSSYCAICASCAGDGLELSMAFTDASGGPGDSALLLLSCL